MNFKIIEKLIAKLSIGKIKTISIVSGGLSHRMYKVITNKGTFAVKELNPNVMKRTNAYFNFIFSEQVTDIAIDNGIPAIGTIKFNKKIIQEVDNSFFMIFNWIDGKVLKSEEITEKHCKIIGKILAQIHNIDFSKIEDDSRKQFEFEQFEWNKYLKVAKQQNKSFINLVQDNINLLYELNEKSNTAQKYASNNLVISHTDLDRKNVMWQENNPFIIDWEASGYINPTIVFVK